MRERVSQSVALRFAARLGWSKRHRGVLMAARLRARAGADDARAASFYLARFACTSPHERIRAFTSGEDLIVCRFSLNQPAVTVYKVRFSKCATPVRAARFTFQNVLHCKSGLREIARANDAFVALTAQGVWTVPLGEVR